MSEIRGHPIRVSWSDAHAAFVAVAPGLPACSVIGDARREAAREPQAAFAACMRAAQAERMRPASTDEPPRRDREG